jgi:hypothetical protein
LLSSEPPSFYVSRRDRPARLELRNLTRFACSEINRVKVPSSQFSSPFLLHTHLFFSFPASRCFFTRQMVLDARILDTGESKGYVWTSLVVGTCFAACATYYHRLSHHAPETSSLAIFTLFPCGQVARPVLQVPAYRVAVSSININWHRS